MNYAKASGILLAKKYLPRTVPFTDIIVIQTLEEWEDIKGQYGDFITYRTDTRIGRPRRNVVSGTNGFTDSLPDLIRKVNREDPEGVVLILPTRNPPVPRYEYGGGFNIVFHLEHSIILEKVGPGFDGHELTRDLAVHERWQIPWSCLYDLESDFSEWWHSKNDASIIMWQVDDETYAKQRQTRVDFLCNECHYDRELVEKNIPKIFRSFAGTEIAHNLMTQVIYPLVRKKSVLERDELWVFSIQGNYVYCQDERSEPQVWELFRP